MLQQKGCDVMKVDELNKEKDALFQILLHQLNSKVYPLACQSFTQPGKSIDTALSHVIASQSLHEYEDKERQNEIVRLYVLFRLELARSFGESLCDSSFLRSSLQDKLHFTVPSSLDSDFPNVHKLREMLHFPIQDPVTWLLQILTLLAKDIQYPLLPLFPFLRDETDLYFQEIQRFFSLYKASMAFCDPAFDGKGSTLPQPLVEALGIHLGQKQGDFIWHSAQSSLPLLQVAGTLLGPSPKAHLFFYHYLVFRMYVFSFFCSYLWQEPNWKHEVFNGLCQSPLLLRWVKKEILQNQAEASDFQISQRLYLKIHTFMRQWPFFDPKNQRCYYRYFPNFTMSIADKVNSDDFEKRLQVLLQELAYPHTDWTIPDNLMHFLIQESQTFITNASHTAYFSYSMGLKHSKDFVAPKETESLWKRWKKWVTGD